MRLSLSKSLVPIAILTLSLLLRLLYFLDYPIFRLDELYECLWSYLISLGKLYPLTNTAPFIGALYNYLAALFYTLSPSITSFRLLPVITGSLTPFILYFLVRDVTKDQITALISSLILALMPPHILIASHVAWSASLTPLLFTLSLYLIWKAYRSGSKLYWVITGIVVGLAIQSHPSIIASYIGIVLASLYIFKLKVLKVAKSVAPWFITGFLIGYANMVVYNIVNPLHSLMFMAQARWTGISSELTIFEYLRRLRFITIEYVTMYPSGIPIITLFYYMKQPLFYIFISLFTILIILAVLRSRAGRALLIYLMATLCILALGTRGFMVFNIFGFTWGPHYLQQLTPLTAMLLSLGFLSIRKFKIKLNYLRLLKGVLLGFSLFMIMVWPTLNMIAMQTYFYRNGYTNQAFLSVLNTIDEKYGNIPMYVMYDNPYRDPALTTLHFIAVLEGVNIYPRMDKDVIVTLRDMGVKMVGENVIRRYVESVVRESTNEFVNELYKSGIGAIVMSPNKVAISALKELGLEGNFTVIDEQVISMGNVPIFRVVVIEELSSCKC